MEVILYHQLNFYSKVGDEYKVHALFRIFRLRIHLFTRKVRFFLLEWFISFRLFNAVYSFCIKRIFA